jgi:hypothetical protein
MWSFHLSKPYLLEKNCDPGFLTYRIRYILTTMKCFALLGITIISLYHLCSALLFSLLRAVPVSAFSVANQ